MKKENNELTRADIVVDPEMDWDCDTPQELTVYLESWFDVDKKFGLHILDEYDTWLNLYAKFNVQKDSLSLEYEVSRDTGSEVFPYTPTEGEAALIKSMIREKCLKAHGCTVEDYIAGMIAEYAPQETETGMQNIS